MIASIRMWVALAAVAVVTIVLIPLQHLGMKTGLFRDSLLPKVFHKVATRALGFRVEVEGEMTAQRPLLLVANHLSWSDITVLGSVAEVSFVAKSEMANWPLFGLFARLQRSVFVERDRKRKAGDQASELAGRLGGKVAMVLFAEGTTSDGNFLMPFKSTLFGAARAAIANGGGGRVTVQPVAIVYTRQHGIALDRRDRSRVAWIGDMDLIPHLVATLHDGSVDATIRFGEPIEFTESSDRKAVAREVEARVRAMMIEALKHGR